MSHHSGNRVSDEMAAMFNQPRRPPAEALGPTGQFPHGKLTPSDEGEIRIGLTHVDGKVVFDFGKPTAWIGFTPAQARDIAVLLLKNADAAEGQ